MLRYAARRDVATGRLLHSPVTRTKLGEPCAATDALDALVTLTARAVDQGQSVPADIYAACKVAAPELAWQAVDELAQMLGGRGYIETNLVPQMMRDVRILRVFEGPTETLRVFLGARVASQGTELRQFLSSRWRAETWATQLEQATAQLREQAQAARHWGDDESARRQWLYSQCGELATWALLAAAAEARHAVAPGTNVRRAKQWAEARFSAALDGALRERQEAQALPVSELEAWIGSYEASIGDVEQTLAGEQHGLDRWLRKDFGEGERAVSVPGASPPVETAAPPLSTEAVEPAALAPQVTSGGRAAEDPAEPIRAWMIGWIAKAMRMPRVKIDIHRNFADFGLDSIKAIEFAQDLEAWLGGGIEIEEAASWKYPSIAALAEHVVQERARAK